MISSLVVACGIPPKLLQFIEHPLDAIAVAISADIARNRGIFSGLWRDHRLDAVHRQGGAHFLRVVALAGKHCLRLVDRHG